MGFRFRRSVRILPGVRLNISKSGISTSVGPRGAHVTVGKNGTRTTVGIPGTGLSYTETSSNRSPQPARQSSFGTLGWLLFCLIALIVMVATGFH